MTTSKKILLADFIVAFLLLLAVIIGGVFSWDTSSMAAICVGWDAQLATAVGFYYWKAKNENRSKYAMALVEKLAEKHGIENVINLANVILKD